MNDDHLKIETEGIGYTAMTVKYHRSCYLNYICIIILNYLYNIKRNFNEIVQGATHTLFKSFKLFREIVIESRNINSGVILTINKLLKVLKILLKK